MEEFIQKFEKPRVPVVISGLLDRWPANKAWEPSQLLATYASHKFKVLLLLLLLLLVLLDWWCCSSHQLSDST